VIPLFAHDVPYAVSQKIVVGRKYTTFLLHFFNNITK